MAKKKKKKLDLTRPVARPSMPLAIMFRMFVIGIVGVAASAYAIYRHYYTTRPSMLQPVPSAAPEPSSSEWIPVPEFVPVPSSPPASPPPGSAK